MRILFGDKEAYLNKFKTCARSRPLDNQILGQEFYSREHTKPLFNQHGIMNVRNLHIYHCSNEILKILKFRTPYSLFELFELSKRNRACLITLHSNFEIFQKGHPAVEIMLDQRIFER